MFNSYDPAKWHEDGVLVEPPRGDVSNKKQRRTASWKVAMVVAVATVLPSVSVATNGGTGQSSRFTVARGEHRYSGNQQSNPDVLTEGYWSRFNKRKDRLRPFAEDGVEDPDPPF